MKRCSLLLLSLAIVSCAPPYSAELNASAGLAGQMTLLSTLGPVNSPDGDSTTAIKFLPIKPTAASLDQVSSTSGFLVSESSGSESLSFAFQDSSGKVQTSGGVGSFSLAGADPNYPLYEYDVMTTTATANIVVFHLEPVLANETYQLFTAAPTGPFTGQTPQPFSLMFALPALAAQVFPILGGDEFNFLLSNPPIYQEETGLSLVSIGANGGPTSTPPGAGTRVLYYHNSLTALSYASYYTAGQWVCYQWVTAGTPQPTGITNRIDALLTNGDLISTQDGTLTIYDPNGTEVSSVPLGGMQFCYEAYVGSTPYVFFSLTLHFPHNSWIFRVYAIPTSKLRGLKG